MSIFKQIIGAHIVSGEAAPGNEIAIRIDQTLTQDSTGTMAYLQFESMGVPRVKTQKSVAYIDHNTLQTGFENADDHRYIQTVARRHGVYFSRPGNGICHQVHLERFGKPGLTLLGSDSHTPNCGGLGMCAIGAGGLDVALAMAGEPYYLIMPRVYRVWLEGSLSPMVTAKDVILELLRRLSVKGGVDKVIEYAGPGVKTLSVSERATITNMGAELGATTSIFPSDEVTRRFLKAQGREEDWVELSGGADDKYEETLTIDLSALVPLAAQPHSPDNVASVSDIGDIKVQQVAIGSCTNSSFADLMKVAAILDGKTIADTVSLVIAPGSRQVMEMLAQNGALVKMMAAGARILENTCGPCIGMGQAPATDAVSLRTFNRNFPGRSGTATAQVYLVSPETAAASALTGMMTDPRTLDPLPCIPEPDSYPINDNMIIPPASECEDTEVVRGPNIKPFPIGNPMGGDVAGSVLIKLHDNITTDHIAPAGAKLLPYRSNIPYQAEYCLTPCDEQFPARAKAAGGGVIVAGENYGQGSSREHAALVPLYLGVRAVLAKSFARIHRANLINNGIIPLVFVEPKDYATIAEGDELLVPDAPEQLRAAVTGSTVTVRNLTQNTSLTARCDLTPRHAEILISGGLLAQIRDM